MRRLAVLAAVLLASPAIRAAEPPASGEHALLADFVEIGRVDRSLPRDLAMVELYNMSTQVLDVVVGEGSATLQPKDRLIARVAAGDRDVTVRSRQAGVPNMEGRVRLEAGVRYELALTYGLVPAVEAPIATPGVDVAPMTPSAPGSPQAGSAAAPRDAGQADRQPRRTKSGRVDIGRRRR